MFDFEKTISNISAENRELFEQLYDNSSEVIVFGSCATEDNDQFSDLDILFIGPSRSIKRKGIDFVCVTERRAKSKSWLGSEIASHVAKYGVLIKGPGHWRSKTFVSRSSYNLKREKVAQKLCHIYFNREKISDLQTLQTLKRPFLDLARLWFLYHEEAVPPTAVVIKSIFSKSILRDWVLSLSPLEGLGLFFFQNLVQDFNEADIKRLLEDRRI